MQHNDWLRGRKSFSCLLFVVVEVEFESLYCPCRPRIDAVLLHSLPEPLVLQARASSAEQRFSRPPACGNGHVLGSVLKTVVV